MGALSKASKTFCCFALLFYFFESASVCTQGWPGAQISQSNFVPSTFLPRARQCVLLCDIRSCVPLLFPDFKAVCLCVLFHFTPYQPRDIFSGLVFGSLKMQEIYKSLAGLSCSLSELGHTPIPESLPMGQEMN